MVRRRQTRWMAFALAGALLAGGCAHRGAIPEEEARGPFRLGREDVVEVSVYRDPELSRTVPVRPDGKISLPIIGEVEAAGRTPDEIREEIVSRLKGYVKDPAVVAVIVHEVHSPRFFVVGEVGRPGAYPLRGEVTLLQGLALAGGLGDFSARRDVTVVRAGGERFRVLLKDLWKGKAEVSLRAGDTLVVP